MKYAIVIEETDNNLSAYIPDLPGCVATGKTKQEILQNMKIAIKMHLEGMKEDGLIIPSRSKTHFEYIEA